MTTSTSPRLTRWLYALAGIKLLVHLVANRGYGIFRDELYYLACAEHLDWGYVDHPPLVAVLTAFARWAFGESLSGLRLLPAVAGALVILLTGLIARELGGGRFAQALAALGALVVPSFLAIHNYLSMNAFDHLFWALCLYVVTRILRGDDPRLWLVFGLLAGLGLQNKISVLFMGFGVVVGVLLARRFELLSTRWIWIGGALAGLLFLPHLLWQAAWDWPTLEFMHNARVHKNVALSPLAFLGESVLTMHPATLPLWLMGLGYLLFSKRARPQRALGFAFLAVFGVLSTMGGKPYYLTPAYPPLFAAGAVAWEALGDGRLVRWLRGIGLASLIVPGVVIAPMALPVLPADSFVRYSQALGLAPRAEERHELAELPQHYANMLGWEEMVRTVAGVYDGLSPEEQRRCAIFTTNYGRAGAIDFYGPAHGLPRALSGHNNYFLWGTRGYSGDVLIIIGGDPEDHRRSYDDVRHAATIVRPWSMPYENNVPVFVCRGPKRPLAEIWPHVKGFI